jgi:hypothetical protein
MTVPKEKIIALSDPKLLLSDFFLSQLSGELFCQKALQTPSFGLTVFPDFPTPQKNFI